MFESSQKKRSPNGRYGVVKAKAQIFSSSDPGHARTIAVRDFRQLVCDQRVVREVLVGSDHLSDSTWSGSLATAGVRHRLLRKYPSFVATWSRWMVSFRFLMARRNENAKSFCLICHNATQPFFTNLAMMNQAAQAYGCIFCGLLMTGLSLLLRPVEDGVLWADRHCNQESICILANITNGKLKELRLWNCYTSIDATGPKLSLLSQMWLEFCGLDGEPTVLLFLRYAVL